MTDQCAKRAKAAISRAPGVRRSRTIEPIEPIEPIAVRAIRWATGRNDTGLSSNALCAAMMGVKPADNSYPHDRGDFGRCVRLLEAIPEWRSDLSPAASILGPYWRALINKWNEIEAAYRLDEAEAARWEEAHAADWRKVTRGRSTIAGRTHALIGSIISTVRHEEDKRALRKELRTNDKLRAMAERNASRTKTTNRPPTKPPNKQTARAR
jgi:hypothetical protein